MINNCKVSFSDGVIQEFHDPYIFNIKDECWCWNGNEWFLGVSYAGIPIMENLIRFNPKHKNDPPPGFKAYK